MNKSAVPAGGSRPQPVVAIDGPSGSGKSSVSREAARRLRFSYLDTGAMYRAACWWCLDLGIDLEDAAAVSAAVFAMPLEMSIDPEVERVLMDSRDITAAIREPRVSEAVSHVATNPEARAFLVRMQQDIVAGSREGIVAEGRDITTVIAPEAPVRILLTASEEARLRRRRIQLDQEQGKAVDDTELARQVTGRDRKDSQAASFMSAADGVTTLDSSDLDFEGTVQAVLDLAEAAGVSARKERA